jgi:hypothetical protein
VLRVTENPAENRDEVKEDLIKYLEKKYGVVVKVIVVEVV